MARSILGVDTSQFGQGLPPQMAMPVAQNPWNVIPKGKTDLLTSKKGAKDVVTDEDRLTDMVQEEARQKEEQKAAQTRSSYMTPEQYQEQTELVRNTPEFQAQNDDLTDLENSYQALLNTPSGQADPYTKPILALADSLTGTNLMKGYSEGLSSKDKYQQLIKFRDDISKRKSDQFKNLTAGISKMKSGQDLVQLLTGTQGLQAQKQENVQKDTTQQTNTIDTTKLQGDRGAQPRTGKGGMEKSKYFDAIDTAMGKDAADFMGQGGFGSIQSDLKQLKEVENALKKTDTASGPMAGLLSYMPGTKSKAYRDTVNGVVQRSLKTILGSQFTKREAEQMMARAYDPHQQEAENARRVSRLYQQIETAGRAKQEAVNWLQTHGSMRGFPGKIWTMADFDPEATSDIGSSKFDKAPGEKKQFKAGETRTKDGVTYKRNAQGNWVPIKGK